MKITITLYAVLALVGAAAAVLSRWAAWADRFLVGPVGLPQ